MIGTQDRAKRDLLLTITAATPRPVQLRFAQMPSADDLRRAIDAQIAGRRLFRRRARARPAYKRHLDPLFRRTDPRGTRCSSRHEPRSTAMLAHRRREPEPGQCLRTFLRDLGVLRRQEGLRRRRLRRLHGLARRQARSFLPGARLPRRRPRDHHDRGARAKDGELHPMQQRLPRRAGAFSAASAPPA